VLYAAVQYSPNIFNSVTWLGSRSGTWSAPSRSSTIYSWQHWNIKCQAEYL